MNKKYDLNYGIPIETQYGDKIRLYNYHFLFGAEEKKFYYDDAPINLLTLIWEAKWPNYMSKYRVLSQIKSFDFIYNFKRAYKHQRCF